MRIIQKNFKQYAPQTFPGYKSSYLGENSATPAAASAASASQIVALIGIKKEALLFFFSKVWLKFIDRIESFMVKMR